MGCSRGSRPPVNRTRCPSERSRTATVSDTASGTVQILPSRGPIGVLISGRGTNLRALIDAIDEGRLEARIAVVISNRPDAPGLEHARRAGIEALVVDHRPFKGRVDFDRAVAEELKARDVA